MNITLTSLEALILKATHESLPCPDPAAVEAFCVIMKDAAEGPMLATQTLAARIHTPNAREAMLALMMLDRCMRRCDAAFHAEVGKFRFLNEMIKLVSPKYFADRTAPEVRTRVLQLLHAWSIEYPKESKFKVAFDMLKNQGVVKETPPPLPPEDTPPARARVKNAIFEDEEKSKLLQKLLQSKKAEDLQHANRLIKTMVREEERRNEACSRRALEVGSALDSAGLLRDMLARAGDATADEEQLIHELHAACCRLRPALQRLAAAAAQRDDINDIIRASDLLDEVFVKYNAFVAEKKEKPSNPTEIAVANSGSLLDFAGANPGREAAKTERTGSMIDELGDIFSTEGSSAIAEPLKPVSLMGSEETDLLSGKINKKEGWNELDSLGEQLLKQSLPDNAKRIDNFNSKTTKKIPMNALEKISPKRETQSETNGAMLDLDFFMKKLKTSSPEEPKATNPIDDVMVDITTNGANTSNAINVAKPESTSGNILDLGMPLDNAKSSANVESKEIGQEDSEPYELQPLTDINLTLDSVHPSKLPPVTAYEGKEGLSVVCYYCKDKPRPDVNVLVISITSKSEEPIKDILFQAAITKGCKIRQLSASGSSLPAHSPFVPPPALTQLVLVARPPTRPPTALLFVLTYSCHNDVCSESGEVVLKHLDEVDSATNAL